MFRKQLLNSVNLKKLLHLFELVDSIGDAYSSGASFGQTT